MANRYIIHGATYCGDGTASNEAASAGAVGAWNDINIVTGTTPTNTTNVPSPGDVIYIRSKSSAGADITVTLSADATINYGTPTVTSPLTWILDGGTVWSGINGILKYTSSVATYEVTIASYNNVIADVYEKLVFENTSNTNTDGRLITINEGAYLENALLDYSGRTTVGTGGLIIGTLGTTKNCHAKFGYAARSLLEVVSDDKASTHTNLHLEITSSSFNSTARVLNAVGDNRRLTMFGGKITGLGVDSGIPLFNTATANQGGTIELLGTTYANTINIPTPGASSVFSFKSYGSDGKHGSLDYNAWGWASSRNDDNPPTLNAVLPDSVSTKWSWRVYPELASIAIPMNLKIAKNFQDTAATKTITLEFLISTSYTGLHKGNLWLDVSYIDNTTSLPVLVSNRDIRTNAAIDTSTAAWTSTAWGLVNFTKHKLSITTPTSIKQDTPIIVTLNGIKASDSANAILFVCPDVQLS